MHYANGRPAKNGDKVFQYTGTYEPPVIGVAYDLTPGQEYCGGYIVPLTGGPRVGACLADCLRLDDVLTALGLNPSDGNTFNSRAALAKVRQADSV